MKTLHEEAFCQGIYQPDEVQYAVKKVEDVIAQLEEEVRRRRGPSAPQ
jgi:hypothetical protein